MAHGFHATDVAWEIAVESSSERLVLLALAKYADDDLHCFPSVAKIMTCTSLSKATVHKTLKTLTERGVLSVIKEHGSNNRYSINATSTKNDTSSTTSAKNSTSTRFDTSTKSDTSTKNSTTTSTKSSTRVVLNLVPEHIKNISSNKSDYLSTSFDADASCEIDHVLNEYPDAPNEDNRADVLPPWLNTIDEDAREAAYTPTGANETPDGVSIITYEETALDSVFGSEAKGRIPPCPYGDLVEIYNGFGFRKCTAVTDSRKRAMRKAWEVLFKQIDGVVTKEDGLKQFRQYLTIASKSAFLTGRTPRSAGHEQWKPDFDFFLREKTMVGVAEGKYSNT